MSSFDSSGWYLAQGDIYYHSWVWADQIDIRRITARVCYRSHTFYACVYGQGYFEEQSDSLSLQHAQSWCEQVAEPILTAVLLAN